MKERDEELALFLEMRRKEKENENEKNNLLLLQNSEELDLSNLGMFFFCFSCFCVLNSDALLCHPIIFTTESNRGSSTISKIVSSVPPRKSGIEEFLNSENDKSDYDW